MDTLYNDMCDTPCRSCDLTLIALFYFKNKLFLFLSTAKTNKKNKRKKKRFFYISMYEEYHYQKLALESKKVCYTFVYLATLLRSNNTKDVKELMAYIQKRSQMSQIHKKCHTVESFVVGAWTCFQVQGKKIKFRLICKEPKAKI